MTQEQGSSQVGHGTPVATSQTYEQAKQQAIQDSIADFDHLLRTDLLCYLAFSPHGMRPNTKRNSFLKSNVGTSDSFGTDYPGDPVNISNQHRSK